MIYGGGRVRTFFERIKCEIANRKWKNCRAKRRARWREFGIPWQVGGFWGK